MICCPHINLGPLHMGWNHYWWGWSIKSYVNVCLTVGSGKDCAVGPYLCVHAGLLILRAIQALLAIPDGIYSAPGSLDCKSSKDLHSSFHIMWLWRFFTSPLKNISVESWGFSKILLIFSSICLTLLELFLVDCPSLTFLFQADAI